MRFRFAAAFVAIVAVGLATSARAEEPVPESGGSCPAQEDMSAQRADLIARLQAQVAAQEAQGPGGDVVVLNGRGYRYDSDQVPTIARDVRMLEMELARARAEARAAEGHKP